MIISSVSNKEIKEIRKLKENKFMEEKRLFLIEGEHLIKEAFEMGLLKKLIVLDKSNITFNVPTLYVTSNVMKSISNLPSITNVIGICSYVEDNSDIGNKILILDGVQDPGNVGTIIRSSKAFNFDTIVLSTNSVKKYNDKLIRATQGMLFKTNVITRNLSLFINELKIENYLVYGTNVVDGIDVKSVSKNDKIAIVMGSEGTGVSKEIRNMVDKNIYINMNKDCESLNVSVAASIIMYELGR